MQKHSTPARFGALALAAAALAAACSGGGGSGTNSPSPTTPGTGVVPGSIGATVTLSSSGASPLEVRIEPSQRVRFVNNDTRPHEIQTNPHLFHTDCPPGNVSIVNPGQSADTGIFNDVKACGYHNHLLPDDQKYWGTIRVGTSAAPGGPVYSEGS